MHSSGCLSGLAHFFSFPVAFQFLMCIVKGSEVKSVFMTSSSDTTVSRGMLCRNYPPLYTESHQRTVIVLGVPRGGTSMVAKILSVLGVFMGDKLGATYEDPDFFRVMQRFGNMPPWRRKWHFLQRRKVLSDIQSLVAQRNVDHEVWGWKFPGVISP